MDLGGPSYSPKFSHFMPFLGKSGKFVYWRPPPGLMPPPMGIPGTAPKKIILFAQSEYTLTDTYLKFSVLQVDSVSR